MAYYDALIAEWPSVPGATTQDKLANLNAMTVSSPQKALLSANAVFNAIALSDYIGLTQLQQAQLANLLSINSGGNIDGSSGTLVRNWFASVFAGKTSLVNLQSLVAPFDDATEPWWQANGYSGPIGTADLALAGGLS